MGVIARYAGLLVAIAGLIAGRGAMADPAVAVDLPRLATGMVKACPDGRTLLLTDGQMVRLAGIDVPLPIPGGGTGPLPGSVRDRLCALAMADQVIFYGDLPGGGAVRDRYGRLVAHGVRADGLWLEGALLDAGLARVRTMPGAASLVEAAIMRERAARADRLGLWNDPVYRVRTADDLDHVTGQFVVLETALCAVTAGAQGWTLELAASCMGNNRQENDRQENDRQEPAAALIMRDEKADFAPGLPLLRGLIGHRLRLRGTMVWRGRPVLRLTHRAAVEPLGDDSRR